jgi:hypothetical protein
VQHLRTNCCIAHAKVNTPNLKKLEDRSRNMLFVGYELDPAAYRFFSKAQGNCALNILIRREKGL